MSLTEVRGWFAFLKIKAQKDKANANKRTNNT
jgi:hypothetical protein